MILLHAAAFKDALIGMYTVESLQYVTQGLHSPENTPHRKHSFSLRSKLDRFLIPGPGQKIATSPLQRLGQYVQHLRSLSLSLAHKHSHYVPRSFLFFLRPLLVTSLRRHHSAQTPQQPCAIREEPTAAILINIDSVSTYPSGSVANSRYCINTPTANTTHRQY